MPSAKIISAFSALLMLSACASFPGGGRSSIEAKDEELNAVHARVAALETEVAQLKEENAELAKKAQAAQRERDQLAAEVESDEQADAIELAESPPSLTVTARNPQPRAGAVVDEAKARALAQAGVPIETAPRLVQPTFASNEMVFENEADGEIQTTSILFGVHLASYRHAEEAREGWRKLQRENPDELGLLEPRIETIAIPDKGEFLRLIGGGFSSNEKAQALCANLKQKGHFCSVVSFQGQRLSLAESG